MEDTKYTKFILTKIGEEWTSGRKAQTIHKVKYYITGITFHEGDGMKAKSFHYSKNRDKAAKFGKLTAQQLAADITKRWRFIDPVEVEPDMVRGLSVSELFPKQEVGDVS